MQLYTITGGKVYTLPAAQAGKPMTAKGDISPKPVCSYGAGGFFFLDDAIAEKGNVLFFGKNHLSYTWKNVLRVF